ncbi:MAG: hypothetical protein ACXQTE_01330 [Methanosarcinaceae archaeon]
MGGNIDEWRYRCPNGHASWKYRPRNNDYRCDVCGWVGPHLIDFKDRIDVREIVRHRDWCGAVAVWMREHGLNEFVCVDFGTR